LHGRVPAARRLAALAAALVSIGAAGRGGAAPVAPDPSTVLVVANASDSTSLRVAAAYVDARGIPPANLVRIDAPAVEEIDRRTFDEAVSQPIRDALWKAGLIESVRFIVTTKGVPLKIAGTEGLWGNRASVDSELALLYRRIARGGHPVNGRIPNPYFAADSSFCDPAARGAERSSGTGRHWDIYLVTRIDAFTEAEAMALIHRGLAAGDASGCLILDQRGSGEGDLWMRRAAERLRRQGARVLIEESAAFLTGEDGVLGFCSWGSNDPNYPGRGPLHRWLPGAIATGFVSSDARTFLEPPPDWKPGTWRQSSAFFAGTPQSLLADLIREGITGGIGNAYEPYLDGCARPDILFSMYLSGFTLAESCYMALPFLSWQAVVIGDPLCRLDAR
jgi:uncharacterized protein (TIGR03790 family)